MSKVEEGRAIYPEGVVSPREKLDYLKVVYGIDKPNLFDAVIKELIVDAFDEVISVSGEWSYTDGDKYYNENFGK